MWMIDGMQGLGDNIYQRSILREVCKTVEVYLTTSWPQLYSDLPVKCVRPNTRLRTQAKNIERSRGWHSRPSGAIVKRWHYVHRGGTIIDSLCQELGLALPELDFSGPPVEPERRERPYILIRPATVRKEWRADSRNPLPQYLSLAAEMLRGRYHIISVADLRPGEEEPVGPLPYADERHHAGEIPLEGLLRLVSGAHGVLGGVGWLVPAAAAYTAPMALLFGGWGNHNGPNRILDPRMKANITCFLPDQFCMCSNPLHNCNKKISNLEAKLEQWILRLDPQSHPAVDA